MDPQSVEMRRLYRSTTRGQQNELIERAVAKAGNAFKRPNFDNVLQLSVKQNLVDAFEEPLTQYFEQAEYAYFSQAKPLEHADNREQRLLLSNLEQEFKLDELRDRRLPGAYGSFSDQLLADVESDWPLIADATGALRVDHPELALLGIADHDICPGYGGADHGRDVIRLAAGSSGIAPQLPNIMLAQ